MRKVLTSPNHTITTFFKKTDESDILTSSDEFQNCSTSSVDTSCSSTEDQNGTRRNRNNSTISMSSSTITQGNLNDSSDTNSLLESDQELAERLQMEYDLEWQKNNQINNKKNPRTPAGKKKPLQVRSKNFMIDNLPPPSSTQLGNKHRNDNLSVLIENHSRKKKKNS